MLRILNLEPEGYSEQARRMLLSMGELAETPMGRDELLQQIGSFDVLIVRLGHRIDREILERAKRLKVIVTPTTGLDHIDVGLAAQMGIRVLSLKGEIQFLRSIPATAEHAWGLLLALVRNTPRAFASVLEGKWQRDDFIGHDLKGRRLGVLGLGRIGEKVARYGLAFEMAVSAYDPLRTGWMEAVTRKDDLGSLLEDSDILTIHVPFDAGTERMIGHEELRRLPRGAYLINTSRGGVVDEEALCEALGSGQLGGAAVDVICGENQAGTVDHSPLVEYARGHTNLLITPHIGGATHESMRATELFMAQKLHDTMESVGSGRKDDRTE